MPESGEIPLTALHVCCGDVGSACHSIGPELPCELRLVLGPRASVTAMGSQLTAQELSPAKDTCPARWGGRGEAGDKRAAVRPTHHPPLGVPASTEHARRQGWS